MRAVLFAKATVAMLKLRRASTLAIHAPGTWWLRTRCTAVDQQFTKIGVASLADPAEPLFATCRIFFRGQTYPGCKVATRGEIPRIAHCRRQCRGGKRPDGQYRHQSAADLILPRERQDLLVESLDLAPVSRIWSTSCRRASRAIAGTRSSVSTSDINSRALAVPLAAVIPNSAKCPRSALTAAVRWRTSRSRLRWIISMPCCSSLLTGTNRIPGG